MKYKYSIAIKGKLYRLSGSDRSALIADVVSLMQKNNIISTIEDISRAIDRQSAILDKKKKVSFSDAVAGASALIKMAGGASVSTDEMYRRSVICGSCPNSSKVEMCGPCGASRKIAVFINSIRTKMGISSAIPPESSHSYCTICGCSIALMIVTKMDNFKVEADSVNNKRPDMCWLKRTSKNFSNE